MQDVNICSCDAKWNAVKYLSIIMDAADDNDDNVDILSYNGCIVCGWR